MAGWEALVMPLRVLFFDLNSFFASVEQQERPELRGRPVAVAPVLTGSTCCIAASYEAKAFGIRTGTGVSEALQRCPQLCVVEARPRVYVAYHHRILAAVDTVLPVAQVHSIDEGACRLLGKEQEPAQAVKLALKVRATLLRELGPMIRCSIGLGPNTLLAKVASERQKPDGLTVIPSEGLPESLHHLALCDLPGVGPRMERRLSACGIHDMRDLCSRSALELQHAWGSVVGRWWWDWLRGVDLERPLRQHRTLGHSHVLAPAFRSDAGARAVLVRLLHKAAARLRHINYWTSEITVSVRYVHHRQRWDGARKMELCQDTLTLLETFSRIWEQRPRTDNPPMQVSVTFLHLVPHDQAEAPLFAPARHRGQLAQAMDRINQRYGAHTLHFASLGNARHSAPMRISFTCVPDPSVEA